MANRSGGPPRSPLALTAVVLALALGQGIALADSLLFPYLSTENGVLSFVTLVNDGQAENTAITGYRFTYAHKPVPVGNRQACSHANGEGRTTPADMMTFEVGGRIREPHTAVLFESEGDNGVFAPGQTTSTAFTLPVTGQVAFLVVQPVGAGAGPDDNQARLFGWVEIVDTVNNLSLAYSTHNFVVDANVDPDFTGLQGDFTSAVAWYPDTVVNTTWHVLPLGSLAAMVPPTGGGIRAVVTLLARYGGNLSHGAFDRDEQYFSGAVQGATVRCFGFVRRADLLQSGALAATANGGWSFLGPDVFGGAVPVPVTDPDDPGGVYDVAVRHLVHRIQVLNAAVGLGPLVLINREPSTKPGYSP